MAVLESASVPRAGGRTTLAWLAAVARSTVTPQHAESIPDRLPDDALTAWNLLETRAGVDRAALTAAIARHFHCDVADLTRIDPAAVHALPEAIARRYGVLALTADKQQIVIATANPGDLDLEQDLAFATGRSVRLVAADPAAIRVHLDEQFAPQLSAERVAEQLHANEQGASFLDEDLAPSPSAGAADDDPTGVVRRIAATVLGDAVSRGVSDIHLVRMGASGIVRYRIDGIMQEVLTMPASVYGRVVSRIKVIGKLDISDRLRPQDGRARIVVGGKAVDLRLSTIPVQGGDERMVIRILSDTIIQSLDAMDLVEPERSQLRKLLANADGLVLMTGPTGSGKTTTLHAALKQRLSPDVTIMTVENPVEYRIEGVSQVQVEPKQGVTFASVLRAMLRQDPDILLVGEIRDTETAETAAQAAMTGHLVLSTVHADDAPNALLRLKDLGLDADTLGEAFRGAAAQRLVRRLCPDCKVPVPAATATEDERAFAAATGTLPAARAVGCGSCNNSGYKGRLPIHQVFSVSPQVRTLIRTGADLASLRAAAVADGMRTLAASAASRIAAGDTTVTEAVRVLGQRFWEELSGAAPDTTTAANATEATHTTEATEATNIDGADEGTVVAREPSVEMTTAAALGEVAGVLLNAAPPERRERATESAEAAAIPPKASIAVLPFTNMSPDPENGFFADGITDDIISALTQIKGLKVAGRASTFAFKDKNPGLAAIGRGLGVRAVLQGSVRRSGNRVRISAQMMDTINGTEVWSERYDRELTDIFAVQDEIARAIAEPWKTFLGDSAGSAIAVAPRTGSVEAYQLFLRGREAGSERTPESLRRAIDLYLEALAIDPDYALAHAGIAEAYIALGSYLYIPATDGAREASRALADATRLAPDLALVHNLRGQLTLYLSADWRDAGPHFERALSVEPQNPLAHSLLAVFHAMRGELAESRASHLRAIAADPLSATVRGLSVAGFPRVGIVGCDASAALAAHEAALALAPNSVANLWMSAVRLGELGRFDEAERRLAHAAALTQQAPVVVGLRVRALVQAGRHAEATALHELLRKRASTRASSSASTEYVAAAVLLHGALQLGEGENATEALLRAVIAEGTGPVAIHTTLRDDLEPLMNHPRLGPLVRDLSLWKARPS